MARNENLTSPLRVDTALAALYEQSAKISHRATRAFSTLHHAARDRRIGRQQHWSMSDNAVVASARDRVASGRDDDLSIGAGKLARTLIELEELAAEQVKVDAGIADLDAIYDAAPWTRYFPCLNRDGHIHSSQRGCPTVRFDTAMSWTPELSGKTIAAAIAKLGPTLCTVCFPDAPAEHCQNRSDLDRAEREAAKAARNEARYVKNLHDEEMFRGYDKSRVTTVAGCKQALRDEVEFRNYYGGGEHSFHAASIESAAKATAVLLARGVAQAEIDKIILAAEKRMAKYGNRP